MNKLNRVGKPLHHQIIAWSFYYWVTHGKHYKNEITNISWQRANFVRIIKILMHFWSLGNVCSEIPGEKDVKPFLFINLTGGRSQKRLRSENRTDFGQLQKKPCNSRTFMALFLASWAWGGASCCGILYFSFFSVLLASCCYFLASRSRHPIWNLPQKEENHRKSEMKKAMQTMRKELRAALIAPDVTVEKTQSILWILYPAPPTGIPNGEKMLYCI